jgi:non-heme chloroperoxidase
MTTVATRDGVDIFYKDGGPKDAQPIVFHHGWPLTADDWDIQMLYFLSRGYRVIAHDRRGHGRSTQVSDGHDMDHYAADTSTVVEHSKTPCTWAIRRAADRPRAMSPVTVSHRVAWPSWC